MKKGITFIIILVCMLVHQPVIACSTFFINKNGQKVFGRNYDWATGYGMVCSNLKGLIKTSVKMDDANTISWISRFGSMTFNQYGKEFPTGGMNEKGLVVELMWAEETKYPAKDKRPAVDVLQWIQYQLDNNSTIEEVILTDREIRIADGNPPLHYLIADAGGHAACIEFIAGKMVKHKGKEFPFPVLTNDLYATSARVTTEVNTATGNKNPARLHNSLRRFTKASSMIQDYQQNEITKPIMDVAFNILDKVSQGDYTKWSIVYDLVNKKIYFKTAGFPDIKAVNFSSFTFECSAGSKVADMNQNLKGNIDNYFKPFTFETNRALVIKSVEESKSRVSISIKEKNALIVYNSSIHCKD